MSLFLGAALGAALGAVVCTGGRVGAGAGATLALWRRTGSTDFRAGGGWLNRELDADVRRLGLEVWGLNVGWGAAAGGFCLRVVVEELAVLRRSREGAGRIRGAGIAGSGAAFKLSLEAEDRTVFGTGSRDMRGIPLGREGAAGRSSIIAVFPGLLVCVLLRQVSTFQGGFNADTARIRVRVLALG